MLPSFPAKPAEYCQMLPISGDGSNTSFWPDFIGFIGVLDDLINARPVG
jgi:hypothetical protein